MGSWPFCRRFRARLTLGEEISAPTSHFQDRSPEAIGFAVFFDGLDGWIARMTNTVVILGASLIRLPT